MPECFRWTCMLVCVSLRTFAHETAGCSAHPAFPAPSIFGRNVFVWLGRFAPRDCCFASDGYDNCNGACRKNWRITPWLKTWLKSRWMHRGARSCALSLWAHRQRFCFGPRERRLLTKWPGSKPNIRTRRRASIAADCARCLSGRMVARWSRARSTRTAGAMRSRWRIEVGAAPSTSSQPLSWNP